MKILITGITGRIGANLAAKLVKAGHEVQGLVWPEDPRTEKLEPLGLELIEGSLTNESDVEKVVAGMNAVYHLGAAFQGGGPFTESQFFDINVHGTFNMLEAARRNNGLDHFFFASTDAVYEKYPPDGLEEPIREDKMPRRPSGWYSMSKAMGEELCNGYMRTYQTPITILRFCLVVGAGEILDFPPFFLSKSKGREELASLWEGEERLVNLRDRRERPYKKHIADVRDIVQGCFDALGKGCAIGQTFQLAGHSPIIWDRAIPYLSKRLDIPFLDAVIQGPPIHYEFDLSKARRLIGFEPKYDIFRMIDDALAYRKGEDIGVLPT